MTAPRRRVRKCSDRRAAPKRWRPPTRRDESRVSLSESFVDDLQKQLFGARIVLPRKIRYGEPSQLRVGSVLCDVDELVAGFRLAAPRVQGNQCLAQRTIG